MLRAFQWTGLIGAILLIAVLVWPRSAGWTLHVDSIASEMTSDGGDIPLVFVTDEPTGSLTLKVENAAVRLEDHPQTPIGIAMNWDGGGLTSREGSGARLVTRGAFNAILHIKTQKSFAVQVETSGGTVVGSFRVNAPFLADEIAMKW